MSCPSSIAGPRTHADPRLLGFSRHCQLMRPPRRSIFQ
jgi:hypothetical protein